MVQGVLMKDNGQRIGGDEQEKKSTEREQQELSHENQSIGQATVGVQAQQSQGHENQTDNQSSKPRETKHIQRGTHRSRSPRAHVQSQPESQQKISQPQPNIRLWSSLCLHQQANPNKSAT